MQSWLISLTIFSLIGIVNMTYAIRLIAITRGRRIAATLLGFVESATFIYSLGQVVNELSHWHALLAYCLGSAIGGYVGMVIEARFVTGYVKVNIIAMQDGHTLALALREQGYGVTETTGTGGSGQLVTMLQSVALRTDRAKIIAFIRQRNPNAFITVEEARAVHRGWLRTSPQEE